MNSKRFINIFLKPELNKFLNSIDKSSNQSITKSFINSFDLSLDLIYNNQENTFEYLGSSGGNSLVENLINFLDINFSIHDFDLFFSNHLYSEKAKKELSIEKLTSDQILKSLSKHFELKNGYNFITKSEEEYFAINLLELANKDYDLIQKIGIESYLLKTFKNIESNIERFI